MTALCLGTERQRIRKALIVPGMRRSRCPWCSALPLALLILAMAGWELPAMAQCSGPADLEAAVQSNPTVENWAALANWFGKEGQFDCAAHALQSAVRLDPDSAQLNYLLGFALYQQKDFAAAESPLERSIAADPVELNPHLLLASVYMSMSNPRDAATQWRAALDLDSGNNMALHGLSQALLELRDFPGEINLLRDRRLDTRLALDLAIAYTSTESYKEAANTLSRSLQGVQPDDRAGRVLAQSMLAWALLLEGDADAALDQARQASEEAPSLPLAQLSLGRALLDTGDARSAVPVLERARSLDPNNLEVHIALARAYAETGQSEEARAERQLCLSMVRAGSASAARKEAVPAE